MPDGSVVETVALVARIRKFRGRLTSAQIAKTVGLGGWAGVMTIKALCKKYAISTADADPDYRPGVIKRDAVILLAQEALENEIRRARAEAHLAPPYKPGPLEWANPR